MQHGLAEEFWLRVRDQPLESEDRLAAANNLANSLFGQGKHAEAEQMFREVLDVQRRVLGPGHPHTLASVSNLASLDSIRSASIVPFASCTLTISHPTDPKD